MSLFLNSYWNTRALPFTSAVEQSESALCIHVSPLFCISFPFRSPQSIGTYDFLYLIPIRTISSSLYSILEAKIPP